MAVIANLDIVLGARTGKLDAGFMAAQKSAKSFTSGLSSIGAVGDAAFGQLSEMVRPLLSLVPGLGAGMAILTAGMKSAEQAKPGHAAEMAATATATQAAARSMRDYAGAARSAERSKPGMGLPRGVHKGGLDLPLSKVTPPIVPPQALSGATAGMAGLSTAGIAAGVAIAGAFVAVAAGAAGAAIAISGVRSQMTAVDDVSDAAKRLGMTFADLESLRFGLGQSSGLDAGQIDAALQKMQLGLAEAKSGSGELAGMLKALGLDAGQLLQAGPVEAMKQISVATAQLKSPTDQLQVAYQLFGKQGASLVSSLRDGPAAIEESVQAAKDLGLTLTQAQAEQVGAANDTWEKVYKIAEGVFRQIAAEVAPVLQVIGEEILAVGGHFGSFGEYLPPIIDGIVTFAGYLYDANELVSILGTTLQNIMTFNWSEVGKDIEAAFTFDTAGKMVAKVQAARDAAKSAAKQPSTGDVDLALIDQQQEASKKAADAAKSAADATAAAAERAQDAIKNRIGSLQEEVDVLRMGEQAARAMHLARDGANAGQIAQIQQLESQKKAINDQNELMKKGSQLKDQFASPMDKLKAEVLDLRKLLASGSIDQKTFDLAAMDAAKKLPQPEAPKAPPTIAALQRGSVEQYSESRRIDNERQQAKNAESIQRQHLAKLDAILRALTGSSRIGIVGA
jgi:hypothetical protein